MLCSTQRLVMFRSDDSVYVASTVYCLVLQQMEFKLITTGNSHIITLISMHCYRYETRYEKLFFVCTDEIYYDNYK